MRRVMLAGVMCVAASAGAGCGDDARRVGVLAYAELREEAECAFLERCGVMPDRATCERFRLLTPYSSDLIEAVLDGRVRWDEEGAAACLEARATRTCDRTAFEQRFLGCPAFTAGTRGDGAACTLHLECTSGECAGLTCGEACCVGACVGDAPPAPPGLGESCYLYACAEGRCDDQWTCVPWIEAGGACTSDEQCGDGLACIWAEGGRRCTALSGRDEPCLSACAGIGDVCTQLHVCTPATAGPACCGASTCPAFHRCAEGRCVAEPIPVGEACGGRDERGACDAASYCAYGADGPTTCQPRRPDGAACTWWDECESSACLEGACARVTCAPPG